MTNITMSRDAGTITTTTTTGTTRERAVVMQGWSSATALRSDTAKKKCDHVLGINTECSYNIIIAQSCN